MTRTRSAPLFLALSFCLLPLDGYPAEEISLSLITTTRNQIVLGWTVASDKNPVEYELQRSLSREFSGFSILRLPPEVNVYSDTGYPPDDKKRFTKTNLWFGYDYYYRVRARYRNSYSVFSNTVSGSLRHPVRGEVGDLFADAVLGQPNFAENSAGATTRDIILSGGGILIDSHSNPERAYFVDLLHNRILGFADVHARPLIPDIVIGQPDFTSSAPNGEATMQSYPDLRPPSASTLALTHPDALSVVEAVLTNQLAVDQSGALYVADPSNHRVLKYEDPFTTDTIADEVWGQPDFTTRVENYGGLSERSIRFMMRARSIGLTIDPDGSLWVADSGNQRVLRFPYRPSEGSISKSADLVLLQPDFTTATGHSFPTSVQVAEDGTVYVAERQMKSGHPSRIAVFQPPLWSGMAPIRALATRPTVERPTYLLFDPLGRGLWVQNTFAGTSLLDLRDGHVIETADTKHSMGFGADRSGNLYAQVFTRGIFQYPPPYTSSSLLFKEKRVYTGRDFCLAKGAVKFGDQLVVTEGRRMLIWNDADAVETYAHADDIWGQEDFSTDDESFIRRLGSPKVDARNRLWVFAFFHVDKPLKQPHFRAFKYPLEHGAPHIKEVTATLGLVDRTGSITISRPAEWLNFDLTNEGDQMWIADLLNNRVIRVNNIDGGNDPSRGAYVDVVLGQRDSTSTKPNRGGWIAADTLQKPRFVTVGPEEHLYVSDNGGEGGSNWRILIFDRSLFPDDLDRVLYGPPATKVLGTGGSFRVRGCVDEICDPGQTSFYSRAKIMVCGMGPYNNLKQRFPLVYLNPSEISRPILALGDACATPKFNYIDDEGNVYIVDYSWARILIYKKPFSRLEAFISNSAPIPAAPEEG